MREILYILSPSFSGSTLLTFMLATHPEIATVGELKASAIGDVESYRCSCGALLKQCDFWRKVKTGMKNNGAKFDFSDIGTHFSTGPTSFRRLIRLGTINGILRQSSSLLLRSLPFCRTRLDRIIDQNRILIDLIGSIQCGRLFLDGSKDPERLNQLLLSEKWKVRVVHLLRDGRGVANSYQNHNRVNMRTAASEWVRTDRACARVASWMSPRDVLTVKYEDVCQEPQVTLARIFSFAGLMQSDSTGDSPAARPHILGNAMRLNGDRAITLDERWKGDLGQEDLKAFEAIAGDYNRSRGYKENG